MLPLVSEAIREESSNLSAAPSSCFLVRLLFSLGRITALVIRLVVVEVGGLLSEPVQPHDIIDGRQAGWIFHEQA